MNLLQQRAPTYALQTPSALQFNILSTKDNPETTHDVPRVFVVHPILSGHQIMKKD